MIVDLGIGADVSLAGGKARGLQRLLDAGLPCPPAFCVTTEALDAYLGEREPSPTVAFEAELPVALEAELATAVARLRERCPGVELVAVRSSAADEDGGEHSFAGLHETRLGVPLQGIAAAVRACWASLWAEGALAYRAESGLDASAATMAVVVQALVPARAAAVAFTADPLTGAEDAVVIHAIHGLGPGLVDNAVTPDVAIVDKTDLSVRSFEAGDKHLRLDARPAGGLVRRRSTDPAPALTEHELVELAALAVEAERRLGHAHRRRGGARRPLGAAAGPPDHDPGCGMTALAAHPLFTPRDAAAPALVRRDGELTYDELFALARDAAAELDDRDTPVTVLGPKSVDSIALTLGCLLSGRPVLLPAAELPGPPAVDGDGIALILATSGSTGEPKLVPITRAAISRFSDWAAKHFEIGPGTRVLSYCGLNFDLSILEVWTTLLHGGCVVLATRPHEVRDLVLDHEVQRRSRACPPCTRCSTARCRASSTRS